MSHYEGSDDLADDLAGSAVEWVAGLAGLVLPGVGPLTQRLATKVREEVQRERSTALRAAEAASGLSREDLGEKIAADVRLVPLATRLLHAAGMNGYDRVLKAMGTALGEAVSHQESIDECELILSILGDLTNSHVIVLGVVAKDVPGETESERRSRRSRKALLETSGVEDRVFTICSAALVVRGLARMPGMILGGDYYEITELGRVVLEVLGLYHPRSNTAGG